jgi:hypothetical protein
MSALGTLLATRGWTQPPDVRSIPPTAIADLHPRQFGECAGDDTSPRAVSHRKGLVDAMWSGVEFP